MNNIEYDILVTGIASADLIFPGLVKMPEPGTEVESEDFIIKPGGAANIAVALQQLGLKTALITALGCDLPGKYVYEQLVGYGLDLRTIEYSEQNRTPVSAVLSCLKERGFATFFGKWQEEAIIKKLWQVSAVSRHIHGSIKDYLSYPLLAMAKKNNNTLSLDMAWEDDVSLEKIKDIIAKCDIFFANEIEAKNLTRCDNYHQAIKNIASLCPMTVIKLGPDGSIISDNGKIIRVPPVEAGKVIDTTGAGDLYCAGFLFGWLNGWTTDNCGYLGSAAGALCTTFAGGVDSSFNWGNLEALILNQD